MLNEGRRKQYVEVLATHYIDGTVRPQSIVFAAGDIFDIEEVKGKPCRVKDGISHDKPAVLRQLRCAIPQGNMEHSR